MDDLLTIGFKFLDGAKNGFIVGYKVLAGEIHIEKASEEVETLCRNDLLKYESNRKGTGRDLPGGDHRNPAGQDPPP